MRKNEQIAELAPQKSGCNLLSGQYVTQNWFRLSNLHSQAHLRLQKAAPEPTTKPSHPAILSSDFCLLTSVSCLLPFFPFGIVRTKTQSLQNQLPPPHERCYTRTK